MALSEFSARKAKPRDKPYKLSDSEGLYLHVQPRGSKLWRMKYRFGGKEKVLSFGPYPLITIAEARTKRDEAKKQLLEGTDPGVTKKLERIAKENDARQTFGLIAQEYIGKLEGEDAAPTTLSKTRWLLIDLAEPLSKRPIRKSHQRKYSIYSNASKRADGGKPLVACVVRSAASSGMRL